MMDLDETGENIYKDTTISTIQTNLQLSLYTTPSVCTIASSVSNLVVSENGNHEHDLLTDLEHEVNICPNKKKRLSDQNKKVSNSLSGYSTYTEPVLVFSSVLQNDSTLENEVASLKTKQFCLSKTKSPTDMSDNAAFTIVNNACSELDSEFDSTIVDSGSLTFIQQEYISSNDSRCESSRVSSKISKEIQEWDRNLSNERHEIFHTNFSNLFASDTDTNTQPLSSNRIKLKESDITHLGLKIKAHSKNQALETTSHVQRYYNVEEHVDLVQENFSSEKSLHTNGHGTVKTDLPCEKDTCFTIESVTQKTLYASPIHFHILDVGSSSSLQHKATNNKRPICSPANQESLQETTQILECFSSGSFRSDDFGKKCSSRRHRFKRRNRKKQIKMKNTVVYEEKQCHSPDNTEENDGTVLDTFENERSSSNVDESTLQLQFEAGPLAADKRNSVSSLDCQSNNQRKLSINSLPPSILIYIFQELPVITRLSVICRVCKRWQSAVMDPSLWRHLDLRGLPRLKDSSLLLLSSLSDRVYTLNMSDGKSTLVTDGGVVQVLQQCPYLKTVKMSRSFYLSDESFSGLGKYCHNIICINLDGCFTLTNAALKEISIGCPDIQELYISQCSKVSDEGVCTIASNCPHLKKFRLDQCVKVTDTGVIALAKHCPDLEYLHMLSCSLTDAGISHLQNLKNLQVLDVSNVTQLSPRCLENVALGCPKLDTLCVSLNRAIDDHCIQTIAQACPLLKCLSCVACSLSDKGLENLGMYAHNLEHLDVAWCSDITDAGVIYVSGACQFLRYLGFMRCGQVTMETIEQLVSQYPHIQYSNFVLESRRLLERAEKAGFLAHSSNSIT